MAFTQTSKPRALDPCVAVASSSGSRSSALCQRSAGDFSRHRITSAASAGGTMARRFVTGSGASVTCAASTCRGVAPVNGGRPVSIS